MNILFTVLLTISLVSLSALCSGLNVALLTLNVEDLKRKAKLQDKHAMRAFTIRKKVHFYLSGILLANVAFASATSVVLGNSLTGFVAVIISTLLLVVFAEITPQAIAIKYAMPAISIFSPAIKVATYVGYPITRTLEMLLDTLVGKTQTMLHTRRELSLLIADHLESNSELDENEVEIVQSALKLSETRVKDIMTPFKKSLHVHMNTKIGAAKFEILKQSGYSRIPVVDTKKSVAQHYLLMKDLYEVDFESAAILAKDLPKHKAQRVGSLTALDTLFQKIIGSRKHMIFVEKDNKTVGMLTIEDLIEATIGHEIHDETDK